MSQQSDSASPTPPATSTSPGAAPSPDQRPHRPADDSEEVYFHGSPLLRGEVGKVIAWGFAGLVLIAVPIVIGVLSAWPPLWVTIPLILLGLLLPLVPLVLVKAVCYRISNYRIDYERGLLSRRIDTLELWHVDDISFYQSLLDRILRVGTITVVSDDQTTPELRMRGLPTPRPIFESLKQRIIAVKRQRGVIKMDIG